MDVNDVTLLDHGLQCSLHSVQAASKSHGGAKDSNDARYTY